MVQAFSTKDRVVAIIQYALLYYMLLLHGSVYFALDAYHDLMLGGMLLLDGIMAAWFIYKQMKKQGNIDKGYVIFLGIVLVALFISALTNGFSLGVFSILNVAGRLAFAYLVYHFDENHAANRMARLCTALALISLFFYAVQLIKSDYLLSFMPCCYFEKEIGYVLPVYTCIVGSRNFGIYTEPGRYQIVLGAVLFLLLQGRKKLSFGTTELCVYIVITLLALITTKSTTGYFTLVIIFGFFLFERNKEDLKKIYYWILELGIIGIVIDLIRGKSSLLYNNVFNKLFGNEVASINATSRISCMKADVEVVRKFPLGSGYEIYNNLWERFIQEGRAGGQSSSCVGLTKCTATMGIQTTLVLLGGYVYFLWKNYKSIFARLAYILFFFNTTLAQPDIVYPVMIMVLLFKDQPEVESQENR